MLTSSPASSLNQKLSDSGIPSAGVTLGGVQRSPALSSYVAIARVLMQLIQGCNHIQTAIMSGFVTAMSLLCHCLPFTASINCFRLKGFGK